MTCIIKVLYLYYKQNIDYRLLFRNTFSANTRATQTYQHMWTKCWDVETGVKQACVLFL